MNIRRSSHGTFLGVLKFCGIINLALYPHRKGARSTAQSQEEPKRIEYSKWRSKQEVPHVSIAERVRILSWFHLPLYCSVY